MDAQQLLLKSYWGSSGWKTPVFTNEENKLLYQNNLSRQKITLNHDQVMKWAIDTCNNISKESIVNAFLYSLSTRKLEYRSPLGSYAHLHHMKSHIYERADGFHTSFCKTCGFSEGQGKDINFSVLSFEKYKWGGVRHYQIVYMAYDLEQFSHMDKVSSCKEDYKILHNILDVANTSKNFTVLKKNLSKVIKSNDSERGQLCQILGYTGIIQPDDCPSFADSYIDWCSRGDGKPKSDMKYPIGWWEGNSHRKKAVKYWFPES